MNRVLTDLSFLAFVCVFVIAVQFHDHALFFQQTDPYTVASSGEAPLSTIGAQHPCSRNPRGDACVRHPHTASSSFGTYLRVDANALVSKTLHPSRLVSLRAHHSSARRSLELRNGQRIFGGNAVHRVYVGVCRRSWACITSISEGTAMARVPGVGSRCGEAR